MNSFIEDNPFDADAAWPGGEPGAPPEELPPLGQEYVVEQGREETVKAEARQAAYLRAVDGWVGAYRATFSAPTRDGVRVRMRAAYEDVKAIAPHFGISIFSLPRLGCCGEPGGDAEGKAGGRRRRGILLGDLIWCIAEALGLRHCAGCVRRRQVLNRIFSR